MDHAATLFTGSGVAIVTPFTNETVNLDALGRLLDFQLQNGTDAVIVCGTTGEATTMSYGERMRTVEFCVEHVDGRVPVIAGSGSNSTETAVSLSRDAQRAGADGLLVVTPYYNKASQSGLIRHYNAVADAVEVPIILYDVPSRTGSPSHRRPTRSLPSTPTSTGSRKQAAISAISRKPETCARRTSPSGPATMTRRRPSACWAAGAWSRWWPTCCRRRCTA